MLALGNFLEADQTAIKWPPAAIQDPLAAIEFPSWGDAMNPRDAMNQRLYGV